VDIVFYKHDKPWHVMRGLIDEIRRDTQVTGKGATSRNFIITGRDFGKVWESMSVWFDPVANDRVTEGIARLLFGANGHVQGNPGEVAITYLKDFFEQLGIAQGINWIPPPTLPGIVPNSFLKSVNFNLGFLGNTPKYFQDIPQRKQYNVASLAPDGVLWDLAYEYSDPMLTELYVDTLPQGDPFSPRLGLSDSITPFESKMAVVMRDKPFPFIVDAGHTLAFKPTWDLLPKFVVNRQELTADNVGRSGLERFNAFYAANRMQQEDMAHSALTLTEPVLDELSIKRHGLRRMDVQLTTNTPDTPIPGLGFGSISQMTEFQRNLLVNWYCMNPYLLSGTLTVGNGRPDIKIGCKIQIPGERAGPKELVPDETYYVEGVTNNWTFGQSIKTTATVTRGWQGTDAEYLLQLAKVKARFKKYVAFWTG
jgi:hypothetical protein